MIHSYTRSGYLVYIYIILALFVTGCSQQQSNNAPQTPANNEVLSVTKVLASRPDQPGADKDTGHGNDSDPLFSELGGGVAYITAKDGMAQVVHNGVPGKKYQEVLYVRLSRDGKRIAYGARTETKWRMVIDGTEGMYFDEMGTPVFSPDGKHLLYDAKIGKQWHLVLNNKLNSDACSSYYDKFFSKDSKTIIALENSEPDNNLARVVIRDMQFKLLSALDIRASGVKYNQDKSRFAALSDSKGKQRAVVVSLSKPELVSEGQPYDEISRMAFGSDGFSLTYVAIKHGKKYIVLDDSEEQISNGEPTMQSPVVRPGHKSAGIVLKTTADNYVHLAFNDGGIKEKRYEEIAFLNFDKTGKSFAYCARTGKNMFFIVNGKESPVFDKVLSPVFSPDGTHVVARVRKDGKRFVVVMDGEAKIVSQHSPYDMVYGTTFTADGQSVAYGVQDGNKLIWKVEKL